MFELVVMTKINIIITLYIAINAKTSNYTQVNELIRRFRIQYIVMNKISTILYKSGWITFGITL